MSCDGEQSGVQYVVSLPGHEKGIHLKTINLKDLSEISQPLNCENLKKLTQTFPSVSLKRNADSNNAVLKVISKLDFQGDAKDCQNQNEVFSATQVSKRLKANISMENLQNDIEDESEETSEILGTEKLSDVVTEDEWDEDALEELSRLSESCQNTSTFGTTGRKRITSKSESYYAHENSAKARKVYESIEKKKGKPKLFRTEWLDIDIFKDWLDKDPTNPSKARCTACSTTMNAGKSELEKHATGARHCQNVQIMQNQQYLMYQKEEVSDLLKNVQVSMNEGESYVGDEVQSDYREQQLEALNRIATSVDSLSTNVTVFFEKLCSNQETLIQILQKLVSK